MLSFTARRVFLAVCVCATVFVVSFVLTRFTVDRPAALFGPTLGASDLSDLLENGGVHQYITLQLLHYIWASLHGDFGQSTVYKVPVAALIGAHMPVTLLLGSVGIVIALTVAVPLGILAATYEGSFTDHVFGLLALTGQAMPGFWMGLLLSLWLGLHSQWLPISGANTWQGYLLPGAVLALSAIPTLMRLTRTGMVDALASDYARTARAKGVEQAVIVLKHALRNAAIPIAAVAAVQLGFMLSGSIIIEAVFSLHGIGFLAWQAIRNNDVPVLRALVPLLAVSYTVLALLADLLNAWRDPDVRGAASSPAGFAA